MARRDAEDQVQAADAGLLAALSHAVHHAADVLGALQVIGEVPGAEDEDNRLAVEAKVVVPAEVVLDPVVRHVHQILLGGLGRFDGRVVVGPEQRELHQVLVLRVQERLVEAMLEARRPEPPVPVIREEGHAMLEPPLDPPVRHLRQLLPVPAEDRSLLGVGLNPLPAIVDALLPAGEDVGADLVVGLCRHRLRHVRPAVDRVGGDVQGLADVNGDVPLPALAVRRREGDGHGARSGPAGVGEAREDRDLARLQHIGCELLVARSRGEYVGPVDRHAQVPERLAAEVPHMADESAAHADAIDGILQPAPIHEHLCRADGLGAHRQRYQPGLGADGVRRPQGQPGDLADPTRRGREVDVVGVSLPVGDQGH